MTVTTWPPRLAISSFLVDVDNYIKQCLNCVVGIARTDNTCLLNQVRGRRPCVPGFLKSFRPQTLVYVCVSAPRPLITSGVIWCDVDRVQLVKQVLQFFTAFNYYIRDLLSIKWMAVAILTQHVVNTCQGKLKWHGTSYKRTTRKMERFIYKSEWANA